MANTPTTKCFDLGFAIAKIVAEPGDHGSASLIICSPSSANESCFYPAQSMELFTLSGILKLRDALNEMFPSEGAE